MITPSTNRPAPAPYYHLTPEALTRQDELRYEANEAARRQATYNQIVKRLAGSEAHAFFLEWGLQTTLDGRTEWLSRSFSSLMETLSVEERRQFSKDLSENTAALARKLPYSSHYGPHFIEKLQGESLASVAGFLQFTREPWYVGLAGFYVLNKADDVAYFRDLIEEHLHQRPEDATPVLLRASAWLTAEIERLAEGSTSAYDSNWQDAGPTDSQRTAMETASEDAAALPWDEIEALAEKMGLRKDGRFIPAGNLVSAAGAGLIDGLLDGGILPATGTRPIWYACFSQHYGQPIKADRTKITRTKWHLKARAALGLPDLKPPKLRP